MAVRVLHRLFQAQSPHTLVAVGVVMLQIQALKAQAVLVVAVMVVLQELLELLTQAVVEAVAVMETQVAQAVAVS
jgi:hypothetical protein